MILVWLSLIDGDHPQIAMFVFCLSFSHFLPSGYYLSSVTQRLSSIRIFQFLFSPLFFPYTLSSTLFCQISNNRRPNGQFFILPAEFLIEDQVYLIFATCSRFSRKVRPIFAELFTFAKLMHGFACRD